MKVCMVETASGLTALPDATNKYREESHGRFVHPSKTKRWLLGTMRSESTDGKVSEKPIVKLISRA